MWLCSVGGILQILLTAGYEYFACKRERKRDDTALWLLLSVMLPVMLLLPFDFYCELFEDVLVIPVTAGVFLAAPLLSAAGIWLGRLAAGKYKGIKKFYKTDIVYIVLSIALAGVCWAFIYKNSQMTGFDSFSDVTELYIPALYFVLAVLYGRFSEFEYMQERLARAMTVGALAFMPCGFAYYNYEYVGRLHWKFEIDGLIHYTAYAAVIASGIALAGVVFGYFLRIMKLGGDEPRIKKPLVKRLMPPVIAVLTIALLAGGIKIYQRYRYYFNNRSVALWDMLETNEEDIFLVDFIYWENTCEPQRLLSIDRETIHGIAQAVKSEKTVKRDYFPMKNKEGEGYTLNVYNDKYEFLFGLDMYSLMVGELYTNVGEEHEGDRLFIADQYYGREPSKAKQYREIMLKGKISDREKSELLLDEGETDYYDGLSKEIFCERSRTTEEKRAILKKDRVPGQILMLLIDDEDPQIRLDTVVRAGYLMADTGYLGWCVQEVLMTAAEDEDVRVRAEAYKLLGCYYGDEMLQKLFARVNDEPDETARFYAIYAWGMCARYNFDGGSRPHVVNYKNGIWANYDFHINFAEERFQNETSDICKLAYACVLQGFGRDEYTAAAGQLYQKTDNTQIKEFIKAASGQ